MPASAGEEKEAKLLDAAGSIAAGAAFAGLKLFHHLKAKVLHRHHHQLRHAVKGFNGLRFFAAVPAREQQLPLIIGVNQPHTIAEHQPHACAQAPSAAGLSPHIWDRRHE